MYAMHDAFRRDLEYLERAVHAPESSREGWRVFREELEFHHHAEDDDLWPDLRARVAEPGERKIIDEGRRPSGDAATRPARLPARNEAALGRGAAMGAGRDQFGPVAIGVHAGLSAARRRGPGYGRVKPVIQYVVSGVGGVVNRALTT